METNSGRSAAARQRRIKQLVWAPEHAWFCPCLPGFEPWLAAELAALGADAIAPIPGGVGFSGRLTVGYSANLHSRLAHRVLWRVASFPARRAEDLFRKARQLPWDVLLPQRCQLDFQLTSHDSWLHHSELVAQTLRDAIARQREEAGAEPLNEAPDAGSQRIYVRLEADRATISLDSTGEHLHRRGYRLAVARAPLRENLAAAALMAAGYQGREPLLDPMVGSGTIAIEAAMIARNLAPGRHRPFAFETWPSFREASWQHLKKAAGLAASAEAIAGIWGRDLAAGALQSARENAERAEVGDTVRLVQGDFFTDPPPAPTGLLVANPPYGVRLEAQADLPAFYRRMGLRLREAYAGWRYAVFVPEGELTRALGLPWDRELRVPHGGLDIVLRLGTVPAR